MSETLDRAAATQAASRVSAALQPVVPGFHPDPTICRVDDDYYLACSSFEYFPAVPLFHSEDLVNWTQIGNILTDRTQFDPEGVNASAGMFAGTLRHHGDRFWYVTTNISDFSQGQLIFHAERPEGPWSSPILVPAAGGIDPDLAWDDDGTCYLTWHVLDFVVGGQAVHQAPIDLTTGTFLADPYPVWQGSGMVAAESPHLYNIGDYWYLLLAEGGTERGHCVTVARGLSPSGPFEACPSNPILTHRSTGHPTQNTGHADFVQAPDGRWAAVYLGVRPAGPTPGFHVLGREVFLAGIDWADGWPVFDEGRYSLDPVNRAFTETFAKPLPPRWIVAGGTPSAVLGDDGHLLGDVDDDGKHLVFRTTDLAWTTRAQFEGDGELRLSLDDRHWCAVLVKEGRVTARAQVGDLSSSWGGVTPGAADAVEVWIAAGPSSEATIPLGPGGPDELTLGVSINGAATTLALLDGRYLSTEVAGGFTGRVVGVGGVGGQSRVRSLSYLPVT